MKLSLKIIRTYGFEERTYKPDWDDTCIDFTLPNEITLTTMTQCNNEPTKSDSLEGLDGYIYIKTKEELDELLKLSHEEVLEKIKLEDNSFKIEKYL